MAKKIITVFGATGSQGNSIVQVFLNDPKLSADWQVRGVTRDPTKESSKRLAAQGVEVVAGNLDDKASLVKALQGSTAAFGVTNYWDTMDMQVEIQQGKNIADAAKETGVQHYIWSSLLDINKLSKGVLPGILHFDGKAQIEEYIREIGIPATFYLQGFYMQNLVGMGMMRQTGDDNAWTFALPAPPTAPGPFIDAERDTGKFIKGIILNREKTLGKRILGSSGYRPVADVIEVFKKQFPEAGKTARYVQMEHQTYKDILKGQGMPEHVAQELLENMRLLDEFGYYGGESLDFSHSILDDKLVTLEDYFKLEKAYADLK